MIFGQVVTRNQSKNWVEDIRSFSSLFATFFAHFITYYNKIYKIRACLFISQNIFEFDLETIKCNFYVSRVHYMIAF